eukprot:TRINITY_DN5109_c0_g1_i1.p1 TRINITY_DN5109_c0_g1~~TRINITY_DN5109_c0_g1_i1.p1  ORF type:complete len:258 (-),score=63.62 TRINITY_DN5109_c0_g1_i1:545-1318(-)
MPPKQTGIKKPKPKTVPAPKPAASAAPAKPAPTKPGQRANWGRPGDELQDSLIDEHDPIYDEEDDDLPAKKPAGAKSAQKKPAQRVPQATPEIVAEVDLQSALPTIATDILSEYYESADAAEVERRLRVLDDTSIHPRFVKRCITMACGLKTRERELTSQLFVHLLDRPISRAHIIRGFREMLGSLADLQLDVPDAVNLAGQFLARAVFDEVFAPADLDGFLSSMGSIALIFLIFVSHVAATAESDITEADRESLSD